MTAPLARKRGELPMSDIDRFDTLSVNKGLVWHRHSCLCKAWSHEELEVENIRRGVA